MRPPVLSARQPRRGIAWTVPRRRRREGVSLSLATVTLSYLLSTIAFFLLPLFMGSGEVSPRRLGHVPRARNVFDLTTAPWVTVHGSQVFIDDIPVESARAIEDSGRVAPRMDELSGALKTHKEDWKKLFPGKEFLGMVNLEIDGDVPAVVVVSVYRTCALAGYPNVNLVVERR